MGALLALTTSRLFAGLDSRVHRRSATRDGAGAAPAVLAASDVGARPESVRVAGSVLPDGGGVAPDPADPLDTQAWKGLIDHFLLAAGQER